LASLFSSQLLAEIRYSPSEVFSKLEYANVLAEALLKAEGKQTENLPVSLETDAEPMHVYELHVTILYELMGYALKMDHRPPPIPASQSIKYTPTDVYYLSELITSKLRTIYSSRFGVVYLRPKHFSNKTPSEVYQKAYELFYRLSLLNGHSEISPDTVFSQIQRAKHDLQASLLILAKRLDKSDEKKKRQLVTAIYGLKPDATKLSSKELNKTPNNALQKALAIRKTLNALRENNKLEAIAIPDFSTYPQVRPVDVFLQTQFIIAELNLLKQAWNIHKTTNNAQTSNGNTPSDVYYEMQHIEYMLNRLFKVLG